MPATKSAKKAILEKPRVRKVGTRSSVTRVRLVHWKAEEAAERIEQLRAAGYEVEYSDLNGEGFRTLRDNPPVAFVIDLSRSPSHGMEVGTAVRGFKSTRAVPLIFVEGAPEKVERIKRILPDATYTTWGRIRSSLKSAITNPPANPIKPESNLAGYSGTPLPKKLGIKPNSMVLLVNAPKDFVQTLGDLPEGVKLTSDGTGRVDLILWFLRRRVELEDRIEDMRELTGAGGIWLAWPKQASGLATDLTQTIVREIGLAHDLVDYKVCAIDATWSGLKFAVRKAK